MKSLKHPYVLALAACMLTLLGTPAVASPLTGPLAGVASAMPLIQAPQPQTPDQQQAEPVAQAQTFTGTIVQQGDSYALQDSSGTTYKLDDSSRAKNFVGKSVTVIGKLDSSTNTIAVDSIRGSSM
ncbi:MAG TPA: DUF5818 domain-containing protein [Terracidiphilus sp.]|nr:DUF5818 domain-containing protein [Terracidiphilus sp.]